MRNPVSIPGTALLLSFLIVGSAVHGEQQRPAAARTPVATSSPELLSLEDERSFISQYCSGCHNDTAKIGGMTLTAVDLAHVDQSAELAEKVIKKLRTGLMPQPTAAKRPTTEVAKTFRTTLESQLDRAAALHPNPGARLFQRLTRDEYARSVHQLLGIDVDV